MTSQRDEENEGVFVFQLQILEFNKNNLKKICLKSKMKLTKASNFLYLFLTVVLYDKNNFLDDKTRIAIVNGCK